MANKLPSIMTASQALIRAAEHEELAAMHDRYGDEDAWLEHRQASDLRAYAASLSSNAPDADDEVTQVYAPPPELLSELRRRDER